MRDLDPRNVGRGRRQVIHQGAGQNLSILIVEDFFIEGAADSLRDASLDLSINYDRIEDGAAILDYHVAKNRHFASLDVDLHLGGMTRVRMSDGRRLVSRRDFET